jgi:hypothetical protein
MLAPECEHLNVSTYEELEKHFDKNGLCPAKQICVIPIIIPTTCICFSNYLFLYNTLHVSDGLSVHHQEYKTVHTAAGLCQTDTATCC